MLENSLEKYNYAQPDKRLNHVIDSYWEHINDSPIDQNKIIVPDSYFKLVVILENNQIQSIFLTGLMKNEFEFTIPKHSKIYGVRLKFLAPEFIFKTNFKDLFQLFKALPINFWSINKIDFCSFDKIINTFNDIFLEKLDTKIQDKKINLSNIVYDESMDYSIEKIADKVKWSSRQINRYINKSIGISLKSYINIQRCYFAYDQIKKGFFYPEENFYDQAHFIKEVKKHTGHTPKELFNLRNDRFIQFKNTVRL